MNPSENNTKLNTDTTSSDNTNDTIFGKMSSLFDSFLKQPEIKKTGGGKQKKSQHKGGSKKNNKKQKKSKKSKKSKH
jgi:hypothetical protein